MSNSGSNIVTLRSFDNQSDHFPLPSYLAPAPNSRPRPIDVVSSNKDKSSLFPVVLLIVGIVLTIIGSLSILALKYHALSALSMTPEIGIGMLASGVIMISIATHMLLKNHSLNFWSKSNKKSASSTSTDNLTQKEKETMVEKRLKGIEARIQQQAQNS